MKILILIIKILSLFSSIKIAVVDNKMDIEFLSRINKIIHSNKIKRIINSSSFSHSSKLTKINLKLLFLGQAKMQTMEFIIDKSLKIFNGQIIIVSMEVASVHLDQHFNHHKIIIINGKIKFK